MPTYVDSYAMPCLPMYVVSVHVVSYAYSILCHSYVTFIVPYPAYLVSFVYLVS